MNESWRYAILVFVVARLLFGLWSWVVYTIQPIAIQNFELSGEPILSIFILRDSQRYIYNREVNGTILTFQAIDSHQLIDRQSNTVWNISNGKALHGKYQGLSLATSAKTDLPDIFPYEGTAPYPGRWLGMWQRFDANWYISIAQNGYGSVPGDIHFPPLFPLLIRLLYPVFNNSFLGGLFISHLATLYALKLLYDLFLEWGDRSTARRGLLFFAIYPTFFFCFSVYTEPLFLISSLLSFRSMSKKAWHWAGFWIFCSILIRLQGVVLLAPMLYLMWCDSPLLRKSAHWAGLAIAGMGGLFYIYLRSMLTMEATLPLVESNLHARLVMPWMSYGYAIQNILAGNATFIDFLNFVTATIFIILLIWGWNKIFIEYNIYTLCSLLIIITRVVETQPLISISRYSLTLFPVFYTLAIAAQRPLLQRVIVYTSIPLSLYLSGQFFIWGWVA